VLLCASAICLLAGLFGGVDVSTHIVGRYLLELQRVNNSAFFQEEESHNTPTANTLLDTSHLETDIWSAMPTLSNGNSEPRRPKIAFDDA